MALKKPLVIFLKGLFMGAADIIPGISGGTIAFITGIYEMLVTAIKDIPEGIKKAFKWVSSPNKKAFKAIIKKVDYALFIPLLLGIAIAFTAGSILIPPLIQGYPALIYSFFTGLILASAIFVYKKIEAHSIPGFTFLAIGLAAGFTVAYSAIQAGSASPPSVLYVFLLGVVALMAMILPGISGAFILVLFGQYEFMLNALRNITSEWHFVVSFILGGIIGLLGFARLLSYLLQRFHSQTLFFLTGLMLGALYVPVTETLNGLAGTGNAFTAALFFLAGIGLVLMMELMSKNKK